MPVYRKGAKWRVVVWSSGTRHDFVLEGTKDEAERFEARKRLELAARDPKTEYRIAPTFSDFTSAEYQTHAETHLKARTWANRVYTLATLAEHIGRVKLSDLHTAHVEAFKNARIAAKIRATTINDDLKVLRAVLAYARKLKIPVADPSIEDIPTRGVKKKRAKAWTLAEVDALLASIREHSPAIEALVVFLLNTGCRKGEALALEWSHVDLKRRLVRIEPSEEWQPKDGEAREIPIGDALLSWLERPARSKRWVFPCRKKERYVTWPQLAFDRARKAAGLHGGPHACRHTYATHFLQARPDLFLLAKVLGHSHAYVTELYSHLLPDHLALARNVVNFGGHGSGTLSLHPTGLPERERARAAG